MKLRSVLKKLKKRTKNPPSEGVVQEEEPQPQPQLQPSASLVANSASEVRTLQQAKVQPIAASSSSSSSSSVANNNKNHQHSRKQQQQQQQQYEVNSKRLEVSTSTAKQTQTMSKKRPMQGVQSSPASASFKTGSSNSSSVFQVEFGVEPKGFLNTDGTWASFGDSSSFFNKSNTGSLRSTESTAAESVSTRPQLSSRRSEGDLSSPADLSRHSRTSSTLSTTPGDVADNADEEDTSPPPPSQEEGRLPESTLSMTSAAQEKRQRPSPTLSHHKSEPSPSPASSSFKSFHSSSSDQGGATSSPTAAASIHKTPSASPTVSQKSPSAASTRTSTSSITARYTSALSNASSATPSPKLFRTRSRPLVLDNHPLFRNTSMVGSSPPKEQATTPTTSNAKPNVADSKNPSPSMPVPAAVLPRKLFGDEPAAPKDESSQEEARKDDDSTAKVAGGGASDVVDSMEPMAKEEAVQGTTTTSEVVAIDSTATSKEEQQEPTIEQEYNQQEQEESQGPSFEEVEMPILSTAPEFDAVPAPQQFTTSETVGSAKSSIAQESKGTTVSYQSQPDDGSDDETAPIGELSFDSHSEGGRGGEGYEATPTEEEYTLDSRDYTYDPDDTLSLLSEDYTDYTHELDHHHRRSKGAHRFSRWIENAIFGMANFMCPMEEGDVYDA